VCDSRVGPGCQRSSWGTRSWPARGDVTRRNRSNRSSPSWQPRTPPAQPGTLPASTAPLPAHLGDLVGVSYLQPTPTRSPRRTTWQRPHAQPRTRRPVSPCGWPGHPARHGVSASPAGRATDHRDHIKIDCHADASLPSASRSSSWSGVTHRLSQGTDGTAAGERGPAGAAGLPDRPERHEYVLTDKGRSRRRS
jgi:hypothetical protein